MGFCANGCAVSKLMPPRGPAVTTLIPHHAGTKGLALPKWRSPTTKVARSRTKLYVVTCDGKRSGCLNRF